MTEPLCRWCSKTLEQHVEWRADGAPVPKTPCLLLRSGFLAREPKPIGLAIFGKPMQPSEARAIGEIVEGLHTLRIGPFSCWVVPSREPNDVTHWWGIDLGRKEVVTGTQVGAPASCAAIEKALTDIETAIRQARGA